MSKNPFSRKTVGFYKVMATPVPQTHEQSLNTMEYRPIEHQPEVISESKDKSKSVYFKRAQDKENKKKYFTQKYGQDQMSLIRKRLAVEDWVFDQLRDLYDCENAEDDHSCKLDLEEVLNFDTELERRKYALAELADAKKPPETVFKFVDELVAKAGTL